MYDRGIYPLLRYAPALPYGDLITSEHSVLCTRHREFKKACAAALVYQYRMPARIIISYLISADGALDPRVLEMLRSLDDGEKLRELVPLPALPRVAVQGHLLLETQRKHEKRE